MNPNGTKIQVSDRLQDLLVRRYGREKTPCIADCDAVFELLSHRSVRAFSDEPLPEFALETMIAAAQSASTSSNLQSWSAVAITDAARSRSLASLADDQQHIIEAPLKIVWLADLARVRIASEKSGIGPEGLDYFELFLIACIDATLAAQNAAVAAEAMGLGVVFIGSMRNHPVEVARLLALPRGVFAVFGMSVGVPDETRPASIKPRLPQGAVLFREAYSLEGASSHIDGYDTIMEQFYSTQRMNRPLWSEHSSKRVSGVSHLSGRDRLKSEVKERGFPLK